MDQRTRKLVTMHKVLHPRDDVDRLYVSRKEGRRGLASIEDRVNASIQRLEDNTMDNRLKVTRKQKWEEKQPMSVLND